MKTKLKKRNPNDTTFRNINALKRRVLDLESAMGHLALVCTILNGAIFRTTSKTKKK